jgi:PAS domain S-box-containing protein
MQTESPASKRQVFWTYLVPRSIRVPVSRFWQWATLIHSDDPIRHALNRGFAHIIIGFTSLTIPLIFALFASGEGAAAVLSIVSLPIQALTWWLNRRGTIYGAGLYVLWLIAAFVLVSPPETYAGADTPIPLLLIFPVITATLFIRPQAGLWALILMMAVIGIQLYTSEVPREHIMRFLIIGTLNLLAITIFLIVGASIFWKALSDSIASNKALLRQQEQLHYVALATQDAIYDWDLRTNFVMRNDTYQRLYASDDPKAAVQAWWESHVHPDDYERVKTGMQNTFRGRSDFWSVEYRLRRLDGNYATVIDRAYVFYDPDGQPIRMIGAMTDITGRKQTEARMRALIDAIPDMIVRHDREGRYLEIKAVPSIPLNYAIPDAIGKTVWEMLPHDPRLAENIVRSIEKVLDTGEMDVREHKLVVDGKTIYREARTVPADSDEVIMWIRDITERKRAEAEHLELALARERSELLNEFISTMSHDLKTPLTIINTSLYLLEKASDPEHQKSRMVQIKEQVEHLGQLIQDLLTISRLDTFPDLVFHEVDINQLLLPLQSQFHDVVDQRHLIFKLDLAPGLPLIWGSEPDLQRALVNLVENALHYTPSDGTVTVNTLEENGQIAVEVCDTGIGIGEDDLLHVFEHFYRATQARKVNTRGTGLGLAIVKKIINRHHGTIDVESHVGQGTTFRVMLPTAPKSAS